MRCPDVGRRTHDPLRIEPEAGQLSENSIEPPNKQPCDVLHEDVAGSNLANDSDHLEPEPTTGSVEAGLLAGVGHVLAREAAAHDVDAPSPGGPVEGSDVVMDRELLEESVALPRLEDAPAVGVKFDRAHAAVAEQHAAEDAAADAGEEVELAERHISSSTAAASGSLNSVASNPSCFATCRFFCACRQ